MRLMKVISSFEFLVICYEMIRSIPGNMTGGYDLNAGPALNGITPSTLNDMGFKLSEGSFEFSPLRRVWRPRPKAASAPSYKRRL